MNSSKICFLLLVTVILFVKCEAICQSMCVPTDNDNCEECKSDEFPFLKRCGNCCPQCIPKSTCLTAQDCSLAICPQIQCIPGYVSKLLKCRCCRTCVKA